MNSREFVQAILRYYDPVTYDLLFPRDSQPEQPVERP